MVIVKCNPKGKPVSNRDACHVFQSLYKNEHKVYEMVDITLIMPPPPPQKKKKKKKKKEKKNFK